MLHILPHLSARGRSYVCVVPSQRARSRNIYHKLMNNRVFTDHHRSPLTLGHLGASPPAVLAAAVVVAEAEGDAARRGSRPRARRSWTRSSTHTSRRAKREETIAPKKLNEDE